MTTNENTDKEPIPKEIQDEAKELSRGAEILPEGYMALARKIHSASKQGRKLRVKLGVDPTSTDLHIGHSVQFRKLSRFQEFGHKVVLIIGGFTAQIGDPSGRNEARPTLTKEQVEANAKTYLDQIGLVLDLEKTELRNNADWLAPLNLNDLLKLAGKVTVAQLLAKEGFGNRLEAGLPISFHETFYPLLQGYDSVAIESDIEFGGTDQRFNILMGRELQPHYGQEPQLAYLIPLLEGTDGEKKMSKTSGNWIALKDKPDDMYGKTMSIPDALIVKYFNLATTLTGQEVNEIEMQLKAGENPNNLKKKLAEQLVREYHGDEAALRATANWIEVHKHKGLPDEIREHQLSESPMMLFKVVAETGLAESNKKAKEHIAGGGIYIDGERIIDPNVLIALSQGESKIIQRGKREFVRIKI